MATSNEDQSSGPVAEAAAAIRAGAAARDAAAIVRATAAANEPWQGSGAEQSESGRVKLTVNLPEREMATLRGIAARRDISMTDAIRRAIAMEQFIEEVERQGGKLLVEQPDHSMRQLVLR